MWRRLTRLTLLDLVVDLFMVSLMAAILVPRASEVTIGRLYPRWTPDRSAPEWVIVSMDAADPGGRPLIRPRSHKRFPREWRKLGLVSFSGLPGGSPSGCMVQPRWPIACDRTNGHDIGAVDDMNILYFGGAVTPANGQEVSPEWFVAG